ncbi:hypothetical protein ACFXPY_36300 [Streptomyces sp. NPDC059153]|uniref:hypothetical protein n=1 Tax=Streptomyces sp. NPDC059153 TaxID=3346743 RepID=UPI0036B74A19
MSPSSARVGPRAIISFAYWSIYDQCSADYLHRYFEPTACAIDGLERALAGLGLLDNAFALDLRRPQDYFHRVWSTAFRAADLADAGTDEEGEYSDTCTTEDTDPEQDVA